MIEEATTVFGSPNTSERIVCATLLKPRMHTMYPSAGVVFVRVGFIGGIGRARTVLYLELTYDGVMAIIPDQTCQREDIRHEIHCCESGRHRQLPGVYLIDLPL